MSGVDFIVHVHEYHYKKNCRKAILRYAGKLVLLLAGTAWEFWEQSLAVNIKRRDNLKASSVVTVVLSAA